jgi:DNA-binding response OmpR family regulator
MSIESKSSSVYDILIIDDSASIGFLLTDILDTKGFTAKWVGSFSTAMDELKKYKPKLIFLDINMPDLNGYKFCQMLKADEEFQNILIYYLTGVLKEEVQISVLKTKADGYLTKPFDMSDLEDVLSYIA